MQKITNRREASMRPCSAARGEPNQRDNPGKRVFKLLHATPALRLHLHGLKVAQ